MPMPLWLQILLPFMILVVGTYLDQRRRNFNKRKDATQAQQDRIREAKKIEEDQKHKEDMRCLQMIDLRIQALTHVVFFIANGNRKQVEIEYTNKLKQLMEERNFIEQ